MKNAFSVFGIILFTLFISCKPAKDNGPQTQASSCIQTDASQTVVNDSCYCFIPNIFTPQNNDGINDTYGPISLHISNYSFKVIGQNNSVLFNTTMPNVWWDGTAGGVLQPVGKYEAQVSGTLSCGTTINETRCFYLAEYGAQNCISKPTTTTLKFADQFNPVDKQDTYPTQETVCP